MTDGADEVARFEGWFHWAWAAHLAAIVTGFVVPIWAMIPLCMFGAPSWMVLGNIAIWVVLTASPLLGVLAIWRVRLRKAYLALALATPIYALITMGLVQSGITFCDGP